MKKVKKIFFITTLIAVFALLAACGSGSSAPESNSDQNNSQQQEQQQSAEEQNSNVVPEKLVVGATTTGAPFTFLNTETNQIDGIMVDIANKIAEHLGVKTEIKETKFSALIPSIQSGKIDIISAGMLMTDEKKEVIDFSIPVYRYGEALVVAKGDNSIKSFDDLKGKNVGAQEGTVFLRGLQEYKDINVISYKSIADMIVELKNGRIVAFLGDEPIVKHMMNQNPNLGVQLVEGYEAQWPGDVGIGIAKGRDELRKKINEVIEKMLDQGEIESILKKWGM